MGRPPKIKLESREYTIAQDVYDTIVQMVMASLVCEYCGWPYTLERPRVGLNTCRNCFVRKYGEYHTLVYVGVLAENGGEQDHKWIDAKGMIYVSSTTQDHKAEYYPGETLKHWGFILPTKGIFNGQEIEVYANYLTIHGDVQNNSVVCVELIKPYGEHYHIPFLCYQDRPALQINKRMSIYQQAKGLVELSRDARGTYHVHDREISGFYDSTVFEVVSDIASDQYDAQKKPE